MSGLRIFFVILLLFFNFSFANENVLSQLNDIEFNNDEYIIIQGKYLNNKISNLHINQLNMDDKKANLILEKLNNLKKLDEPSINNSEFLLMLYSKPPYKKDRKPIVIINKYIKSEKTKYINQYHKYRAELLKNDISNCAIYVELDTLGHLYNYKLVKSTGSEEKDNLLKEKIDKLIKNNVAKLQGDKFYSVWEINNFTDKLADKYKNDFLTFNDFYVTGELKLNNKGKLIDAKIYKSSNNKIIDDLMLSVLKKEQNFSNLLDFSDKDISTKYLYFSKYKYNSKLIISSLNAYNSKDIIWKPYMTKIEKEIKKNWHPQKRITPTKITIKFNVLKSGEIQNIEIIKSSGNDIDDNHAIEAIKKASPVEPLPSEFNGESVPIEFNFDYNVNTDYLNNILKSKEYKNPYYHPTYNGKEKIIK